MTTATYPNLGFWEAGQTISWTDALQRAYHLREHLLPLAGHTLVARVPSGLHLAVLLLATRDFASVAITGPETSSRSAELGGAGQIAEPHGVADFTVGPITTHDNPPAFDGAGLWISSSGTTGRPTLTRWAWHDLTQGKPWSGEGVNERWGIGYAPQSFAGITAVCQALGRAAVVEFLRPSDLSRPAWPAQSPMAVAAATPSFWRLVAARTGPGGTLRPIDTVTVGGEPVDQSLLNLIRTTVGPRRIKQIFGATEFGTLLAIDDELPGLPADLAGQRMANGKAFVVEGRKLLVSRSPQEPFQPTGDLVEITDGRIHVIGRTSTHVNVGGRKANPYRVVQVLQQHPQVLAARVYGIRSPILGQVLAADIIATDDANPHQLVGDVKRYTRTRLDPHECPRRIRLVEDLKLGASQKLAL